MTRLLSFITLMIVSLPINPVFASAASPSITPVAVGPAVTPVRASRCWRKGCAEVRRIARCVHCYRRRVHLCDPRFAQHAPYRYYRTCTGYYGYSYDPDASPVDNLLSGVWFYSPED
jgi:hypothetical protein